MSFIISYPHTGSAAYSVSLRSPQYSDIHREEYGTIIKRSMHDVVLMRKPDNRPDYEYREYTFYIISRAKLASLQELFQAAIGDLINIQDHLGNTFNAILVTDPLEYVEQINDCMWEVSLQLMVVD